MKNIFSFILIYLFSISFYGQNIPFQVLKSEVFKDEYKDTQIVLSEEDGKGGVIIVRSYKGHGISRSEGFYFEHYDSNLKLIKDYDLSIEFPVYQKQKTFLGYFFKDNVINMVDIMYDLKEKAYICTATIVNSDDFKPRQKELFRLTRDEAKQFGFFSLLTTYEISRSNCAKYSSYVSGNETEVMMVFNKDKSAFSISLDLKSEDSSIYKLYSFDNQMNKKFETMFERRVKDKKFEFQTIEVADDGNSLFLLGKIFTDEKKKTTEGAKYQFELTKISKDAQKSRSLDIGELYCKSLKAILLKGKVVLLGMYSDRSENSIGFTSAPGNNNGLIDFLGSRYRYKGLSYFELDSENLNVLNTRFNPFTEQFLKDKYGDDKPKDIKNLIFKNIVISENEDIVFNAEEFYFVNGNNAPIGFGGMATGGGAGIGAGKVGISGSQTYFHFDDIVSMKVDKSGSISWSRNINKRQGSSGDGIGYLSNTSITKNNDTYFFINAAEKIKDLGNERIEFRGTRNSKLDLNIIRINEAGNLEYQKVLDNEVNEVPFMVSDGIVSKNSVFFLGQNGKTKQLLKVTL